MIARVLRELGRPCRLHRDCRPEPRLTNSRLIHSLRPRLRLRHGRSEARARGIAANAVFPSRFYAPERPRPGRRQAAPQSARVRINGVSDRPVCARTGRGRPAR